jgi:hypothetical protein
MYRIKLASGVEETYHSIEEFAAALHGGKVTSEAQIYHQRADRWLSVTNHPHYQIALSRAPGAAVKSDVSKRQVISAVRPSGEVPATRVAPRVETPSTPRPAPEAAARKLTIPAPRKPDAAPLRPEAAPRTDLVSPPAPSATRVLPIRSAEPKVPDLGEGLDLVEEAPASATPSRPSVATPQVDKLLEMLEPPPAPVSSRPVTSRLGEVEILDLGAPLPPLPPEPVAPLGLKLEEEVHQAPAVARLPRRRRGGMMPGLAAAAVLVIGVVVFVWKPWTSSVGLPEGTDIASTTLPRTEAFGGSTASPGVTPAPAPGDVAAPPAPTAALVDSGKAPARDSAPSIVRVAAPRNIGMAVPAASLVATSGGSGLNITPTELIQHYNAAYTEARSELELRMLQIGFTQIFLRSRLTTSSGVQDTRRLITSAATALRQYRSQESQIERSYQDSIGVAGRNLGWTPRDLGTWNMKTSQKESAETLRLTNLMLSQMEGVFILLAQQEGKYRISGEKITFEDAEAAREYSALRVWLNQQADKYAGSGDALPATLRQVVKAIGSTRLPS